jgi:formylglycine-generating enzyme required for sulfatase activity
MAMKQTVTMKTMMAFFLGVLVFNAMAEPTVDSVLVRQRWPWSRLVDIYYKLTADTGEAVDITVTAKNGTRTLTIPSNALSGDLLDVVSGERHIVFDPMKTGDADGNAWAQFNVTLTPTEAAPLYAIVDLTRTAAETNVTYLSAGDLESGAYGAVERNAVDGIRNIYWTGVTNDSTYKTDKIVLRRVRKGTFNFGNAGTRITLTKDFYVGVFEITQAQWTNVMGAEITVPTFTNAVNRDYRPMECISYDDIREIPGAKTIGTTCYSGAPISPHWPQTNAVGSTSFMGKLRSETGLATFDLPTSAQWEYACRANPNVTTPYNDNDPVAVTNNPSSNLDRLGRYTGNGGAGGVATATPCNNAPTANGTAIVGSYAPNNWGLYDMHGNVSEWMLDCADDPNHPVLNGTVDPKGPATGAGHPYSGSWNAPANNNLSSFRTGNSPNLRNRTVGFRLVMNAP